MKKAAKNSYIVFFDFDNTITRFDVLDDMLERFSKDDAWLDLEKRWKNGEIGSRDCLDGQIRGLSISRVRLDRYLTTVKIDPAFKKLIKFLDSRKVKAVILSDDFDYILKRVLKNNKVGGCEIYCNKLKITGNRLIPHFPFTSRRCGRCGHCKMKNLKANIGHGSIVAYVGDGLSDVCPSTEADIVFAKGRLQARLKKEKVPHIPISGLSDVYKYFFKRLR